MKKVLIFFLFVVLCGNMKAQVMHLLWSEAPDTDFATGDGSENTPYEIRTPAQLARLAVMVRDNATEYATKHYRMEADIDLGGVTADHGGMWWDLPIGSTQDLPFSGTFDGNGYSIIRSHNIYRGSNTHIPLALGLFGYTNRAIIKNLKVEDIKIEDCAIAGGLVGQAYYTIIDHCSVINYSIRDVQQYAGGLVGQAYHTDFFHSNASGKISCNLSGVDNCTGGFAGVCEEGIFNECSSAGEVVGTTAVGGFAGRINVYGSVNNCSSTCKTFGTSQSVGGFTGLVNTDYFWMNECRASGSVVGLSQSVGGFAGTINSISSGLIINCISEGQVTGVDSNVGGFVGNISNKSFVNVYDCRSTSATEGLQDNVGGFVGYVGNGNALFSGCSAWGAVNGKSRVGGFVGYIHGVFSNCYAAGSVEGNEIVGGFAGEIMEGATNCYAVGTVKGNDVVGGFGGYMAWRKIGAITIDEAKYDFLNCYATGAVLCENRCGGFVGYIGTFGNFINCYFDKQTTGLVSASGGTDDSAAANDIRALTTSELMNYAISGLQPSKWIFAQGYYPQLRHHAENRDDAIKQRSALSVVPLKLANDTEFAGDVQTFFHLPDTTPAGNTLIWSSEPLEKVDIVNYVLYAEKSNEWRVLTVHAGDIARTILFRSSQSLITADILGIKINNTLIGIDNVPEEYIYTIDCGSTDESVLAEVLIGGYAACKPATAMTLYANIPQTVTITTTDHQTKTYTLVAEKRLPADIFVQRWTDVLAINNNITTNGGYHFTAYEWYKNGVRMAGDKGYIQENGGLDKAASYTATLYTQHGEKFNVCPAVISDNIPTIAAVYPNPVQHGQTVHVDTGFSSDEPVNAVMQLFTSTGKLVAKQILLNQVTDIAMPDAPGQYIMQITMNGASGTFKIAVE